MESNILTKKITKKFNELLTKNFIETPDREAFDVNISAGIWVDVPLVDGGSVASSVLSISGDGELVCFAPREFNALSGKKESYAVIVFPYQDFDKQFFSDHNMLSEPLLVKVGESDFFVKEGVRYTRMSIVSVASDELALYEGLMCALSYRASVMKRVSSPASSISKGGD